MEEVEATAIEQRLEPFAISKSRFCAFLIFSFRVEKKEFPWNCSPFILAGMKVRG